MRFIGWALSALLVLVMAALLYGHSGEDSQRLSLISSYISEYESFAPHWPWIIVSIFVFAVLLVLLAAGFLLRMEKSFLVSLACMLMAGAAMGLFFVAYTPVRRVEVPPAEPHAFWTPRWWFTSQTARTPHEEGMADAYSDVHYHAIRLVLITGLSGMLLLALDQLRRPGWKRFGWCTIVSCLMMATLFLMGEHLKGWHGLWQRLGFALMYAWLWSARWKLTAHTSQIPTA